MYFPNCSLSMQNFSANGFFIIFNVLKLLTIQVSHLHFLVYFKLFCGFCERYGFLISFSLGLPFVYHEYTDFCERILCLSTHLRLCISYRHFLIVLGSVMCKIIWFSNKDASTPSFLIFTLFIFSCLIVLANTECFYRTREFLGNLQYICFKSFFNVRKTKVSILMEAHALE